MTYSSYEQGMVQPDIRALKELAKIYDIIIDSLLDCKIIN